MLAVTTCIHYAAAYGTHEHAQLSTGTGAIMTIDVLLPELRAYALSLSKHRHDSEDLVQDAIERALRSDKRPKPLADLRPWMFRIIRNLHVDETRKKRVRMEYSNTQSRLSIDLTQSHDHAEDITVRTTFATLPPAMREVLFLVDVMGMKYAEAAKIMDVPHGTVMSRISRARRALIEAIEATPEQANKDTKR